jgi:hypothetical protein
MNYELFKVVFIEKAQKINFNKNLIDRYYKISNNYNLSKENLIDLLDHILDTSKIFPTPVEYSHVARNFYKSSIETKKNQCTCCDGYGVILATTRDNLSTSAFICPKKCDQRTPQIIPEWRDEYIKNYIPEFKDKVTRNIPRYVPDDIPF